MIRAAGYCRVSSKAQAASGLSLDAQSARLRERAEREGWDLEIFVERGFTGRTLKRPVLSQVLDRLHEFDLLVLPKLDRLGRNEREMNEFRWRLEDAGVRLLVLDPEIDFATPTGKIVWSVMTVLAEDESDRIGQRVAAAAEARAKRGRRPGGPAPFGFKADKDKQYVPDEDAAVIVRRFLREIDAGRPLNQIARDLNTDGFRSPGSGRNPQGGRWTPQVISRMARKPAYAGLTTYKGELYEAVHDGLVERELWERVQRRLDDNRRERNAGPGRLPARHLFVRGLLRCGHCGAPMATRSGRNGGKETYACRGRLTHGADYCSQTPVPRERIDTAALAYFERVALDLDATRATLEVARSARLDEVRALQREAEEEARETREAYERVRADYAAGRLPVDAWLELRDELADDMEATAARLAQATKRLGEVEADSDLRAAEDETLDRIAALRVAVAGDITRAADLSAVRGALARIFERFDLGRLDLPDESELPAALSEGRRIALEQARNEHITGEGWVVVPWSRPESVEGFGVDWEPVLRREPLSPTNESASCR